MVTEIVAVFPFFNLEFWFTSRGANLKIVKYKNHHTKSCAMIFRQKTGVMKMVRQT